MGYKFKLEKPPEGSPIKTNHPLFKGLVGAYLFNNKVADFYSKPSNGRSVFTSNNVTKGIGYRFDSSTTPYLRNVVDSGPTTTSPYTIAVGGVLYTVATGEFIVGNSNAGSWSPSRNKFLVEVDASSKIRIHSSQTSNLWKLSSSNSVVAGVPFFVVISSDAATNTSFRILYNNVVTTGGTFVGSSNLGNEGLHVGSRPDYNFNEAFDSGWLGKCDGDIFYFYHWDYQMTEALMRRVNDDPYDLFVKSKRRNVIPLEGGSNNHSLNVNDAIVPTDVVTVVLPDALAVNVNQNITITESTDCIIDQKMLLYQNSLAGEANSSTQGLSNKNSGTFVFNNGMLYETSPADAHAVLVTAIPKVANLDFKFRQSIGESGSAFSFYSPIYRAKTDYTEGYTFIWDGVDIGLYKRDTDSWDLIADTSFTPSWTNGDSIYIRVQANSNSHSIKFWKEGDVEPSVWDFTTTDSTYTSANHVGFYHSVQSGSGTDEITEINYVRDLSDSSITLDPTSSLAYFSPYNWRKIGNNRIQSANPGAYFKANFTGTSFKIIVDIGTILTAITDTARWPTFAYQIDGGSSWTNVQITQSVTTIVSGLSAGSHSIKVVILRDYESYDRWNIPDSAVRILGLTVDPNCSLTAPTTYSRTMIAYGDSITEGVFVDAWTAFSGNNSTKTWAFYLSDMIKAEVGIIGWSFSGYIHAGNGNIPALTGHWDDYDANNSRLVSGKLSPMPDYVFVEHGTNDGGDNSVIQLNMRNQIASFRGGIDSDTLLFIMIPFNQTNEGNLSAAITAQSAYNPIKIDLGSAGDDYATGSGWSYDNFHPNAAGNFELAQLIYDYTGPYIDSIPETSDNINVNESVTIQLSDHAINTNEAITVVDEPTLNVSGGEFFNITADEEVSISEFVSLENHIINLNVNESISIAESITLNNHINNLSTFDSITLADVILGINLICNINTNDSISLVESRTLALSDLTINTSDSISLQESITNYCLERVDYTQHVDVILAYLMTGDQTLVEDVSGNGNNGTKNSVTYTPNGKYYGAFNFDGTSDYITGRDIDIDGATQLTVHTRIKHSDVSGDNTLVMKGSSFGATTASFILFRDDVASPYNDTYSVIVGDGFNSQRAYTGAGSALNTTDFRSVAFTYLGGSATGLSTYLDGVFFESTSTSLVNALLANSNSVILGKGVTDTTHTFLGDYAEIIIIKNVLTEKQLREIDNYGINGKQGLVEPSINDSITVSESVSLLLTNNINLNDTITVAESVIASNLTLNLAVNDSVSVADEGNALISEEGVLNTPVNENISVNESVSVENLLDYCSVNDQTSISELITCRVDLNVNINDVVNLTDTNSIAKDLTLNTNDAISLTESNQLEQIYFINSYSVVSVNEDLITTTTISISENEDITLTESVISSNSNLGGISVDDDIDIDDSGEASFLANLFDINVNDLISVVEYNLMLKGDKLSTSKLSSVIAKDIKLNSKI